jgi:hypothetical protein
LDTQPKPDGCKRNKHRRWSRQAIAIGKVHWGAGEMAAIGLLAGSAPASAADKVIVGLITKTNTNPFFAKMKDGAVAKAKELDVDLRTYAGKYDGDKESLTEIFGSPPSSVVHPHSAAEVPSPPPP